MKCHKCEKEFNAALASSGTGWTYSVFVCPYCGWEHYEGYIIPGDETWEKAKKGKVSMNSGPHHMLGNKVLIGENAGKTMTYMDGYPCNYKAGYNLPKEIYCKDCKWMYLFGTQGTGILNGNPLGECHHPNNIDGEPSTSTWYIKILNRCRKKKPKELNKNNNCKWFEEKRNENT